MFYMPQIMQIKDYLPVRVLMPNCIDWFSKISESLNDDVKNSIQYYGLNPKVEYHTEKRLINDIAYINNGQIHIFENYNQYLWSVSYYMLVIFDDCIQEPMINGAYNYKIEYDTPNKEIALAQYISARKLLSDYEADYFWKLPNCEMPSEEYAEIVGKVNGIFSAGIAFIIAHEFAHKYLGHSDNVQKEDSIKQELDADNCAIENINNTFKREECINYKLGIIAVISSFLFMSKDSISWNDTHPDWVSRIQNAIEKLELSEDDNLWGIASFAILMWMNGYKEFSENTPPAGFENYKESFCFYLNQLREIRNKLYPYSRPCKKPWEI